MIRMKIPFPSVSSELAYSAHMYICVVSTIQYKFVKCQTLKPYMLIQSPMEKYCDETPDITRNPFTRPTRIDCDKKFTTSGVAYADSLLTERRPDVCEELFAQINEKLSANDIALDEAKLVALNPYISRITTFSKDT